MREHVTIEMSYAVTQRVDKFLELFNVYVKTQQELLALKKEKPDNSVGGDFEEEEPLRPPKSKEKDSYKHPISGKEVHYE